MSLGHVEISGHTSKEAHQTTKKYLRKEGTETIVRDKSTLEALSVSIIWNEWNGVESDVIDQEYVQNEFFNIMTRQDCDQEHPDHVKEHLNPDADGGNIFWGNEVRSALNFKTIQRVIDILRKDKNSRRGVLNLGANEMFSEPSVITQLSTPSYRDSLREPNYAEEHHDIPCLLNCHFLHRDELHLKVSARSSDIYLGMPYDWWLFHKIHKLVASMIDEPRGEFCYDVNVLHAYKEEDGEGFIGV